MRARALALSILSSVAVLTVGWQLGTQGQTSTAPDAAAPTAAGSATTAPTTPATPSGGTTPTAAATPIPTATNGGASPSAPASDGASDTFTGTSVQTRFGPVQVQVQITVANGSITDVTALQLTDKDQRSVSISNRAAPVLRQEVLTAQSANVQGISGATYTSDAYLRSLQSALDQAGL
ncbi:FMN-binding protein [Herbiconiux sp. VKM Ac-1786]|uniref:FMN-binding protein n=1 Tax=Herbiconiux sp. VKM Ac-1786 TaxID=2783824 RepID=UPI001889DEDC|nr:FMN-binding protein [Herbiconiux sp. VKM Ac-1786]